MGISSDYSLQKNQLIKPLSFETITTVEKFSKKEDEGNFITCDFFAKQFVTMLDSKKDSIYLDRVLAVAACAGAVLATLGSLLLVIPGVFYGVSNGLMRADLAVACATAFLPFVACCYLVNRTFEHASGLFQSSTDELLDKELQRLIAKNIDDKDINQLTSIETTLKECLTQNPQESSSIQAAIDDVSQLKTTLSSKRVLQVQPLKCSDVVKLFFHSKALKIKAIA